MTRSRNSALDSSHFIESLASESAFKREAAALSLGCMGDRRAGRPLAGLLLREVVTVPQTQQIAHEDVVCAASDAIRRLGATESLYAVMRVLCTASCTESVERATIESLVDCVAEVGGFTAVREAADKVVSHAREHCPEQSSRESVGGLETVGMVLFEALSMCGDPGVKTLERLSRAGPEPLKPLACYALSMV